MDTLAVAGYAARWTTEDISGEKTVTETEWLACTEPEKMLEFLKKRAGNRKLRLFAAACARSCWVHLEDERLRRAVDVVERRADGTATRAEEERASEAARNFLMEYEASDAYLQSEAHRVGWIGELGRIYRIPLYATGGDERWVILGDPLYATGRRAKECTGSIRLAVDYGVAAVGKQSNGYIRCLFGNPFRPVTISPAVLAWNDAVVVRLAQTAYEERHLPAGTLDNSRLAVLADALEEAGCSSEEILGHLRGPGPHVRGCWPVDLCLGKA